MVTGVDLIKEQLRIAAGERLRLHQDNIQIKGSSIECRINAEDYENSFMPCPGKIESLILPGGPKVRIDTHIYPGYEISPHYDSLVAKLITHGNTRSDAIRTMLRSLNEFTIAGIKTTVPFHIRLLENPLFLKGEISTHFVQDMLKEEGQKE
jgi:acetyl-CoA carboxylase biotin carboxylase subunit